MAAALPFISAGLGVIGLFKSAEAASDVKQARKEEAGARKRQQKTQQRIADVKANAAKRKAIAAKRIKEGHNLAAAYATGTQDSSVFAGVTASGRSTSAAQFSDAARIGEEVRQTNIFTAAAEGRAQSFMDSAASAQSTADIFSGAAKISNIFDE